MKSGWGSAITRSGVDISVVENLDDGIFLFPSGRVHLEVSSDKELARHFSDCRKVLVRWWGCRLKDDQAEMNVGPR